MVNWQDISSEFNEELVKEWENMGFSYEEAKDWINVGLRVDDFDYAGWLRNQSHAPEWVLNQGSEELRQEFQQREREYSFVL